MNAKFILFMFGFYIISCAFCYWLGGSNKQNKIENNYNKEIISETTLTDVKEEKLNDYIKEQRISLEELKNDEKCNYIYSLDISECL